MTHVVKIYKLSANEALELVRELEQTMGLSRKIDFNWAWHPVTLDPSGWDIAEPAHLEFRFKDPAVATFVELKYLK